MKFAVLLTLVVINIQVVLSDDNFKRVASYLINNSDEVKNVFMTKYIRNDWINAVMFCEENDMELLRIENLEEYSKIQRALKIHSMEFKDSIFVDGKSKSCNDTEIYKWVFMTNEKPVNESVLNATHYQYTRRGCLALTQKDILGVMLTSTECSNDFDFLCQKVVRASEADKNLDEDVNKPIMVDVQSRMFKKLGKFHRKNLNHETEYFLGNFPLSSMMASQFCKHFNMKLVNIHSEEELKHLGNLLLRQGTIHDAVSVDHVSEIVLEKFVTFDHKERCFKLIMDNFKPGIISAECNKDEYNFMCESLEEKTMTMEQKNRKPRTNGMRFIGSYEAGKVYFIAKMHSI